MSDRNLEIMAELQGKDLDEVLDKLTSKTPAELKDDRKEHLESIINADEDPWEMTKFARSHAATINDGTYRQRESAIDQFIDFYEDYDRNNIDQKTIEDFLKHTVNEGYAEGTMEARYWQIIAVAKKQFNGTIEQEIRDANRKDIIKEDDDAHESKGQGATPITEEAKDAMVEEAPSLRLELMVRLAWQCGLRAKELAELELDKIELDKKQLTVETAKRTDGDERTLFYNLTLKKRLDNWINGGYRDKYTQAANSDYLLPTHKSDHPYPRNVTRAIRNLAEDAGVQEWSFDHAQDKGKRAKITVHSFRKAFGIRRIRNGASVREVQLLLGHSVMSTTEDYLDLDVEDLREADQKYR